jgi:ubiquitin C-terminal hydrolase
LGIDLPTDDKKHLLIQLIKNSFSEEIIDEYDCEKCHRKTTMVKVIDFSYFKKNYAIKFPKVLVINLKRYRAAGFF